MNLGYVGVSCEDGDVDVRFYYDPGFTPAEGQTASDAPLVDGPRGYCLDITNKTGRKATLRIDAPQGTFTIAVQKGDPVTTGPQEGRSRTAAQVRQLGLLTRGDASGFSVQC